MYTYMSIYIKEITSAAQPAIQTCISVQMYTYMSIDSTGFTSAALPAKQTCISANICRIYTHTCIYMYTCKHIHVYLFQRNQLRRGGHTTNTHRCSHCSMYVGGRIAFFWNLRGVTTHVYTYMHIPIYPYTLSR